MDASGGRVALGFNRPLSRIGREITRRLAAEDGASMFNWFVAGHEIPADHWYFREEEGGRILGNLCHWTDFVLRLVPEEHRYPIEINPTRAEKADSDIAVTYTFGDGSIAAITFSAKGPHVRGREGTVRSAPRQHADHDGRLQDARRAGRRAACADQSATP